MSHLCTIIKNVETSEGMTQTPTEGPPQATANPSQTINNQPQPNDVLTELQKNFMGIAFHFAYEALAAQEVPVGCIFVYNNEIIARGRNTVNETRNATRHAEINCIDQVNEFCKTHNLELQKVFSEISVYVTVEPCIMCAAAIYDLSIKCVVFGCKNDRFGGQTVFDVASVLKPVTEVKGGYRAEEAMNLLKEFYTGTNPSAPPEKVKVKGKKGRKPLEECTLRSIDVDK